MISKIFKFFIGIACNPNQVLDVRKECPKTCLDPLGKNDCGELRASDGCFCLDGYVLNSNGLCVKLDKCGCKLPDGSGFLSVNNS